MIMQAEQRYYTPEEYLEIEVNSQERHEYIDGQIIPITGGTPQHNDIVGNLYIALKLALKRPPYSVYFADQRLWIPQAKIHTYPDIMVIEGELQFKEGRKDTLTNPTLIAEVLSDSTKSYDKTEKFAAYRTISSFQEYLLVDQYTLHIEHYVKTATKRWIFSEYDAVDENLMLSSVSCQITLADIYNQVNFEVTK
jgi:Uma2 family endonuclease